MNLIYNLQPGQKVRVSFEGTVMPAPGDSSDPGSAVIQVGDQALWGIPAGARVELLGSDSEQALATSTESAASYIEQEIERKRASVGIASTILNPLPHTDTGDTAIILQALDDAAKMFTNLFDGPIGLSNRGRQVLHRLVEARELLRYRIRQDRSKRHVVAVGANGSAGIVSHPDGEDGECELWDHFKSQAIDHRPGRYVVQLDSTLQGWDWRSESSSEGAEAG